MITDTKINQKIFSRRNNSYCKNINNSKLTFGQTNTDTFIKPQGEISFCGFGDFFKNFSNKVNFTGSKTISPNTRGTTITRQPSVDTISFTSQKANNVSFGGVVADWINNPEAKKLILNGTVKDFNDFREKHKTYEPDFRSIDLNSKQLPYINLNYANLTNAKLINANLENADLTDTNLKDAKLTNASLKNACLFEACLENANLTNANLENANLLFANLTNANLTNTNFKNTYYNDKTKFPAGFDPTAHGMINKSTTSNKTGQTNSSQKGTKQTNSSSNTYQDPIMAKVVSIKHPDSDTQNKLWQHAERILKNKDPKIILGIDQLKTTQINEQTLKAAVTVFFNMFNDPQITGDKQVINDILEKIAQAFRELSSNQSGSANNQNSSSYKQTRQTKGSAIPKEQDLKASINKLPKDKQEIAKRILNATTPYEILGVSENAPESDVKKAYRALSMEFHPDKNKEINGEFFVRINSANQKIKDLNGW